MEDKTFRLALSLFSLRRCVYITKQSLNETPVTVTVNLRNEIFRPLEHWNREFESHSRHIHMPECFLCFCCSMLVVILWRADPLSKESYQHFIRFIVSDKVLNANTPEDLIHQTKKTKKKRKKTG
jgi:hypothetical protein